MADETKTNTTETKAAAPAAADKPAAAPAAPVKTAAPEEGAKSATDGADRSVSSETADVRRATQNLTGAMRDAYREAGVHPALDNRMGDQRPSVHGQAPKPQQVPGPELGHFAEHEAEVGPAYREAFGLDEGDAVGAKSLGPHGRGDESK